MSQSLTLSAGTLMVAVPSLMTLGGAVVGLALFGTLRTNVEVARLNAEHDARTARWLWLRGYRSTPHAGPDVTEDLPALPPAEHEGEVLHVEHATGEHQLPYITTPNGTRIVQTEHPEHLPYNPAGLADLAEEVALVQALSDEPEHDDEDAPADDTDRPGLHLVLAAIPAALWQRLAEWWSGLWATRRERHMVGSGEQATDRDPFAELLAHVEQQPVTIVHRDHRYRDPGMTGAYPLVKVVGDKAAGRHRAEIPAQRDGGDDL